MNNYSYTKSPNKYILNQDLITGYNKYKDYDKKLDRDKYINNDR